MKCAILNHTPFPALLQPYTDPLGRRFALVIAKATWRMDTVRLFPAEAQIGLFKIQQRRTLGELDLDEVQRRALGERQQEEIIWLDHDLAPPKPAFDILVAGYVTAPAHYMQPSIKASLRIGTHTAALDAYVPRYWDPGLLMHTPKALSEAVRRVPISYAVADCSEGFTLNPGSDQFQRLPWLLQRNATCRRDRYADQAAGFGFWPENAPHRLRHAGTFNNARPGEHTFGLPRDFNPRFFNVAHPDLQLPHAPAPGTVIQLTHLAAEPKCQTAMPSLSLVAQAVAASGTELPVQPLKADTLILEPDHNRMSLILRAAFPLSAGPDSLRTIRLTAHSTHAS